MLAARANSTLAELLKDYDEKVGDNRLPRNFKDLRRLLQSIPEVECIQNDYGLEMWQVRKSKQKPEYKYMKKSKARASPKAPRGRSNKRSNSGMSSQGSSFAQSQPKPKRQRSQHELKQQKHIDVNHNLSQRHRVIDMDGYFHNYQLMGDDFMLSMAKIDLGYKFTKGKGLDQHRVKHLPTQIQLQIQLRPYCA